MNEVRLKIALAGPHVSIQDAGRFGYMRFGVPASGPMDRTACQAANVALGNAPGFPAVEISRGGITIECLSGSIAFAVAGGGFLVDLNGRMSGSWMTATLKAGDRLEIRPGHWGNWAYLALAGQLDVPQWLGSKSTHSCSGLGGGVLHAGKILTVSNPGSAGEQPRPLHCPVSARPRSVYDVILGPQERFFSADAIAGFFAGPFRLSDAYDRMGVRLQGLAMPPTAALDMVSEPVVRGSVQVAGDGNPTVLLADHQTTGGYPKIATILDCQLDSFVQTRPHGFVRFRRVTPGQAIAITRLQRGLQENYLRSFAASCAPQ